MHPSRRITKRAVDSLKCPFGRDRAFIWDDALAGFGAAAFPSGKKVYVVQFRQNGRSRRFTLGSHGRLTPDEARRQAKRVLGAVEEGKDPIEERRMRRCARSFRAIATDYMMLHVKPKRKLRTYEEYERILNLHLLPAFGGRGLNSLKKVDLVHFHSSMSRKPGAANRALALFSCIWHWCALRDEVSADLNPVRGVERYPERGRERFLTSSELGRLGEALRVAETTGIGWRSECKSKHAPKQSRTTVFDPHAVAALRLLLLTGARLREILHAKWSYVDWERGLLLLPDSKTGRKTIYLSAAALSVLKNLPQDKGNPYIIPGRKCGAHRADLKKPWAAISRAAGLNDVRIHDLRHTFAAIGAGSSLGFPMIGKLLGHKQPETTARYAHLDANPMRHAANLIGDQIATSL